MKIKRSELKELIKEAVLEMFEDNELNEQIQSVLLSSLVESQLLTNIVSSVYEGLSNAGPRLQESASKQEEEIIYLEEDEQNDSLSLPQEVNQNPTVKRLEEKLGMAGVFDGLEPIPEEGQMTSPGDAGIDTSVFDSVNQKWGQILERMNDN